MDGSGEEIGAGRTIETPLCIIGAGPAGLVIAASLAARGHEVMILESGHANADSEAQLLNQGEVIGDPYAGLAATRHRQVGGTTGVWNTPADGGAGAKYAPLDPCDLAPRWREAPDGWPFDFAVLAPYYRQARQWCGLGEPAETLITSVTEPHGLGDTYEAPRQPVRRAVYQIGSRAALIDPLRATIATSTTARLLTGSTVVHIEVRRADVVLHVATAAGRRFRVQAQRAVLAAGAVENARLLLIAAADGSGVHDTSGWMGRGFMEHPRDRTLSITPASTNTYAALHRYDVHRDHAGGLQLERLALCADVVQAVDATSARQPLLLNASATLIPMLHSRARRARRMLHRLGAPTRWLPPDGHGWSAHHGPLQRFCGIGVLLNVEQPPHHDNAIVLSTTRDLHGTPRATLHWRWHAEDHERLITLRAVFAKAIDAMGIGKVQVGPDVPPDPNAHHHAGTTRMHRDPRHGVVDADGQLHGVPSLFVAGASTFPTAGYANPTLTIVALALRLADHLAESG